MTIAIVVELTAKEGQRDAYLAKMIQHAKASRAEPGCLRFDVVTPQKGGNTIYLYEMWRDQASLDVHANSERIKTHRASVKDMAEGSKLSLCDVQDSGNA